MPSLSEHVAPLLSLDLVAASYRASGFPQDWSRDKRDLEAHRYQKFLLLAAEILSIVVDEGKGQAAILAPSLN